MCVNFRAPGKQIMVETFNAPVADQLDWKEEIWQDYAAPIITGDGTMREGHLATYGMVPQSQIPEGVRKYSTMNARAETVGEKRSFSRAWKDGQRCLVPLIHFYEPNWETGKAVRWKIGMADGEPFAVAGIWRQRKNEDGPPMSFTQLTVNSDEHPLMKRFHRLGDEKRSLIIVPRDHWDDWLGCHNQEEARSFFRTYPADLFYATPLPLPARKGVKEQSAPSSYS